MSVPSYSFHSLPLKLSNKGMEEYSNIILFIPFYSIPFPHPKRDLKETRNKGKLKEKKRRSNHKTSLELTAKRWHGLVGDDYQRHSKVEITAVESDRNAS